MSERTAKPDLMSGIEHLSTQADDHLSRVYTERNICVVAIAKLAVHLGWPAGLARHEDEDQNWDPYWRTIVWIQLPTGQVSWHIHNCEVHWFSFLKPSPYQWDGHTTEQKYERILDMSLPAAPKDEP